MNDLSSFANQVQDRCGSTNDIAKQLAEFGYPHGTWVSTRHQEKGRGRQGRKWIACSGNLFLSIILKPEEKRFWSWTPLGVAVGISRYLNESFSKLSVSVKWPNDLWIQQAKVGGILCEGSRFQSHSFIVAGIGLNCLESPLETEYPATSLSKVLMEAQGVEVTADEVRIPLISSVLKEVEVLFKEGPSKLKEYYQNHSVFCQGQSVQWGDPLNFGCISGLGDSGELQVRDSKGQLCSLYAEDVRIRPLF